MHARPRRSNGVLRKGAAAVELAILLPFLAFLFVVAVDFGRVFYYSLTIENCARNGALYGSDPFEPAQSTYATVSDAALADAGNIQPPPTITSVNGTDTAGNKYVEVTVGGGWRLPASAKAAALMLVYVDCAGSNGSLP